MIRHTASIYVVGIGFRPLDGRTRDIVLGSDVILASPRLSEVFRGYEEFRDVEGRIIVLNGIDETMAYITAELSSGQDVTITLLAAGDPLFHGIGRRAIEEFGKERVEILPDLSSVQVAFARVRESWDDAFLMSLHGGPDPLKRRRLPYQLEDIPPLLAKYRKIAILTDSTNNPSAIAEELLKNPPESGHVSVIMSVCERLGYADERIVEDSPEGISPRTFSEPNVVILRYREPSL